MGGSIGGLVGGLFGSSSAPSGPNTNVYQPGGTANIDALLQQLLSGNAGLVGQNNPYTQYAPKFASIFESLYNNPYASGAQNAANTAGQSYGQVGTNAVGTSNALNQAALASLPGAQQIFNMGLDPQKALYSQQLQQTSDQANVANAQYGLTGQQAAGNLNQATGNFDINWQNQQLNRALAGLSGYDSNLGTAGQAGTVAQQLGSSGAGAQLAGGLVPYTQYSGNAQNQQAALQQYIQSLLGPQTSSEQTISDLGSYLGQGISASEAGQQASLADYNAQLKGGGLGAVGGSSLGSNLFSFLGSLGGGGGSSLGYGGQGSSLYSGFGDDALAYGF